jgi:hypothetical protein
MKTRIPSIVTLLILGAILFSCRTNNSDKPDQADVDAVRTEAVATYASSLTETLSAPAPASPTLRVAPTGTPPIITVTIEPSPTINPCYNLMYLADVTIPDGTQMKAGEVFTKTWRVQNIGGCAWRPGFTFQHVGGDSMRGNTVTLTEAIQTGSIREISVQLVVPGGLSGLIQSSWRMADENGSFFGDTLSVNIVVGSSVTPSVTNAP